MPRSTLFGLAAGVISALLSLTLLPIAPLPLFLAGLSLGTQAATVACATGFFLAWLVGGALMAGPYGLLYAVPALVVMRQTLLHRPGPSGQSTWYWAGGIVSTLTALGMGLLLLAAVVLWAQGIAIVETLTTHVTTLVNDNAATYSAEERQAFVGLLVPLLPGLFVVSCIMVTLINGGIAQSVLTRTKRNLRPKGTLREVNLPLWMSWLIVISAAVALAGPNDLGYIGRNLALVGAVPFFLVGVSLAHMLARLVPWRTAALIGFYLALLLLGPAALLVAGIGIIDQWFGLRQKLGAPGNDQETE